MPFSNSFFRWLSAFRDNLSPGPFSSNPSGVNPDLLLELDFTGTSLPSEVDNYSRASVCAPITGVDGSGGVEVTKFASGAYAYAYHSAFSHSSKTGMLSEAAATNLCTNSESWTFISGTGANNDDTAPDGTTTAATYTRTGGGGACRAGGSTTISNATTYTISCFIREDPANPGANYILDAAGLSDSYTAVPAEWTRVSRTFTSNATSTTCDVKLQNNNESIQVWGMQLELGSFATSYIPTSGASASRARTAVHIANAFTSGYIEHEKGQVDCVYVPTKEQNSDQYYWRFSNGSGSNDRKQLRSDSGGNWRISNGVGSLITDINNGTPDPKSAGVEYTRSAVWDSTSSPSGKSTVDADTDTGGSAYSDGTQDGELYIASGQIADRELEGIIATLTVYSQEQT